MIRQDKYIESDSISQSELKGVMSENFVRKKSNRASLLTGSLTDMILTDPDSVNDTFVFVNNMNFPSGGLLEIIDSAIENLHKNDKVIELGHPDTTDELFRQRLEHEYDMRLKDNTILERISKHEDYINAKAETLRENKILLDQSVYDNCYGYANNFLAAKSTRDYFILKEDEEFLFQYPLFATIDDVPCKGLPDVMVINHKEKYIKLYDLKVTGNTSREDWKSTARMYRYDFQLAFYYRLLQEIYPDYKIENPVLIVLSTHRPDYPFAFTLTYDDLYSGRYGCHISYGDIIIGDSTIPKIKYIFGYEDALKKYKQIQNLKLNHSDVEYSKYNGNFNLNLFL